MGARGRETEAHVAVLGSGSWGTAAAGLIAPNAPSVVLWARREEVASAIRSTRHNPAHLPDYQLPTNVTATSSMAEALRGASSAVLAIPSPHVRATCALARPHLFVGTPVLLLTKGIETRAGTTLASVVGAELGHVRVAVLSGPNHAEEIVQGMVSAAVIASDDPSATSVFQGLFSSLDFRAYASDDVVGVSVCGAMKNVIAVAAGVAVSLGAGDNALAVLMTRGLAEMARMVVACGGDPLTCMGLAGMGDMVATCTSPHSRNRDFGEAFVRGVSLEAYERETGMVVEGAHAVPGVVALAAARKVETPIASAVNAILYKGTAMSDAVASLLGRVPHAEFYGF